MSTTESPAAWEGLYSKLTDNEGAIDGFSHRPDDAHGVHPLSPVRLTPRLRHLSPYHLATICLAVLSAILLIAIIGVTAQYKKQPWHGGVLISEAQKQTQSANASALIIYISKLQQELNKLQKEKEEQLAKLAATKVPEVIKPVTTVATTLIMCPSDWHLFNNSCYFISRNTRDWYDSKSYCQSQGGHLAIIHTADEQKFLWDLLPRGHWNAFWFGITDEYTEDQWKWVDGTQLVGGFWEVGEPNNHIDEDCGYIVKTHVLKRVAIRSWYDAPCSMYCRFICEREMGTGASTTSSQ